MKKRQKIQNSTQLDPLAIKLIDGLQKDGRKSFREIARELDVSEGTIRKRVQNLCKQGIINITAKLNPQKIGFESISIMALTVAMTDIENVANHLIKHPNVHSLSLVTGRYDILATILFHNPLELSAFVKNYLSQMTGIQRVETFVVTEFKKNSWHNNLDVRALSSLPGETD